MAALLAVGAGVWFYFIAEPTKVMIYPAVVLLGFGFSIMIVNSLNFAAELIGDNTVSQINSKVRTEKVN